MQLRNSLSAHFKFMLKAHPKFENSTPNSQSELQILKLPKGGGGEGVPTYILGGVRVLPKSSYPDPINSDTQKEFSVPNFRPNCSNQHYLRPDKNYKTGQQQHNCTCTSTVVASITVCMHSCTLLNYLMHSEICKMMIHNLSTEILEHIKMNIYAIHRFFAKTVHFSRLHKQNVYLFQNHIGLN